MKVDFAGKSVTSLKWLFSIVAALSILFYLHSEGQSVDQEAHALTLYQFSDLEQADKNIDKVIVETRYGMLHSYDELVEATQELSYLSNQLAVSLEPLITTSSIFANDWRALQQLMQDKLDKVEDLKSVKASVHNSYSYLPVVLEEAEALLSRNNDLYELYELVEEARHYAMVFAVERGYSEQLSMNQVIEELKSQRLTYDLDKEIAAALDEVLFHSQNFYKSELELDQLIVEFKNNSWHQSAHRLKEEYGEWFARLEARARFYQIVGTVLSALLVLVILFQVYRLGLSRRTEEALFKQIESLAYKDKLTQLRNRNSLFEALQRNLDNNRAGALVILDINRFGSINLALGHDVGDRVLCEVANRLKEFVDEASCIARLEGNKFGIIFNDLTSSVALSSTVSKLVRAISDPVSVGDQSLDVDFRSAAAIFPSISGSVSLIVRSVEQGLKEASNRRLNFLLVDKQHDPIEEEQLTLFGELQSAIKNGELYLNYQPKVDVKTGAARSVEALVRWKHPIRGEVSPSLFIPFAESTGLIRQLTPWIIKRAVEDAIKAHAAGHPLVFSVNISAIDLTSPFFVVKVQDILDEVGLSAEYLCLEVTETSLMQDPDTSLNRLHLLKDMGLKLSVDDYGTGHASLAYMRDLPVSELKIDRSLVAGINNQERNSAIVRSTLIMCRDLKVESVCEGVETAEELSWLKDEECDLVQGYLISRPLGIEKLLEWLAHPQMKQFG